MIGLYKGKDKKCIILRLVLKIITVHTLYRLPNFDNYIICIGFCDQFYI